MTYKEAVGYLNSLTNYEKMTPAKQASFGLERIQKLLAALGNPQNSVKVIHVAGTKGKGSTCAMIASILKESGFKVGLYTSPHLHDVRERIKINNINIPKINFAGLIERLRQYPQARRLTFFEFLTALAFLYFSEEQVDFAVLETGLGGRLDATNVVNKPLVCVITSISYEHTQILGNTLQKIRREKMAIIKKGAAVVIVGRNDNCPLPCGLLGDHQRMNAAAAVKAVEALEKYGIIVSEQAIRRGLRKVQWPGRLEILKERPLIVCDGAQNRASAEALKIAIKKYFNYNRLFLILGVCSDKDIKGICDTLRPLAFHVIATKADFPRAAAPCVIAKHIPENITITQNVATAVKFALSQAKKSDLLLIAGSLYVVAEARSYLQKNKKS